MSNRTTSAAKRSEASATTPIAIVGSSLLVCSLVFANVSGPIRPVVVLVFLCLVPGVAVVRLLDLDSWAIQASLALALSLTLSGVTAGLLLYTHLWSPPAVVVIVAGVAVAATVQKAGGLANARARLASLATGERVAAAEGARHRYGDVGVGIGAARVEAARLLKVWSRGLADRRVRVLRRPAALQVRRPMRAVRTGLLVRRPRASARSLMHRPRRGGAHSSESLQFEKLVMDGLQARRVRRTLALTTTQELEPQVWLVEDLELRGRGQSGSPPAAPAGVWVTAVTDTMSMPLDWRLLPHDAANGRRAWRSRLALEALDGLCAIDCTPPVIAAGPGYGSLRGFRAGLETRQLDYLVRVEPAIAFDEVATDGAEQRGRRASDSRNAIADYLRARQIELEPFSWTEGEGRSAGSASSRVVQSRFGALPLVVSDREVRGRDRRRRWLVCEWPVGDERPLRFWLSNLPNDTSISDFALLAKLPARGDRAASRPSTILAGQPEWPTSNAALDLQLTLWAAAEEFRALKRHCATHAEG
jgi:hypothetical protein